MTLTPLLVSIIFNFFAHVVFAGMRLAVALDAIHLGASAAMVGTITALFGLLPAVGSVAMGRYIDRHGSRLVQTVCPVLLGLCPLLLAVAPTLWSLALASLLIGGAFLSLHIVNQQVVGKLSAPGDRPANFAISSTWIAASSTLSPMLTGFGIDHIGFDWTFGIIGVVPPLAMAFMLRRVPVLTPGHSAARAERQGSVLDLLRDRRLRRIYAVNVVFQTGWDVVLFMTPIYGAQLHLSASQIGTIIACFSGATFVVRLFTRIVSRQLTPWQALLLALCVSGSASLAFGLASAVVILMAFAFIMGLGHGVASPMSSTLMYEAAPASRMAEVLGLRTSVSMALQVAMPMGAGALGAVIGIAPLYWFVAAMQLGTAWSAREYWHIPKGARAPKAE